MRFIDESLIVIYKLSKLLDCNTAHSAAHTPNVKAKIVHTRQK